MAAQFLNADLEIFGPAPLESIKDAMGNRAISLYCGEVNDGEFMATFELEHGECPAEPETLINQFCDLLESLTADSRQLWQSATRRVIDLGYAVNDSREPLSLALQPSTLSRLTALEVGLAFTIYPSGISDEATAG